MFAKIKQAGIILWAIIASAAAVIGFILLNRRSKEDEQIIEEKSHAAKEHTRQEIEQTPASDLAAASACADTLRREKQSITDRFRLEVQHRLNEKLHGAGSSGTP